MSRLWGDDRAVTVQVGAILLFGVLVLALATYQTTGVPVENERVEFNHNQEVQQDMLDVRTAVAAADGDPRPTTVALGTTYPARVLFVNPAPPSGSLRTTAPERTRLDNAEAVNPETREFIAGDYAADSRPVAYDPSYAVYDAAPTTVVEGPVAVNRRDGDAVALGGQRLVDGRTLSLVVVRGNLSLSGSRTGTVDASRVSTTRRVPVRNATAGPLNVTVPTALSADRWRRLVADEPRVVGVAAAGPDAVNVSLAPVAPDAEPYTLRVGVVDVGTGAPEPAPRYVTSPDAPAATLAPGDDVVVEVRDRYNNPVAGSLNVTRGAGLVAPDDDATPTVYEPSDREDGLYRLRYTGGDGVVQASLPNATSGEENVTVAVTEVSPPTSTGGITGARTLLDDSFEGGLGNWTAVGNAGRSTAQSRSGVEGVLINGANGGGTNAPPSGAIVSDSVDAGDAAYLDVEYWAYRTDGPEPTENEDLRFQYERADGTWVTVDTVPVGDRSEVPFDRRVLVDDADALRDGVRFRITALGDATSDQWYVDDVRVHVVEGSAGSDGTTTAASSTALVDGSGTAVDTAGGNQPESVRFSLRNDGGSAVEVTDLSVDSVSKSQAARVERSGAEVTGGGGQLDATLQIGGASESFITPGTVPAGSTVEFTLGELVNGGGNDVNTGGATFTITVTFGDGSTESYTFTAN